jgi:hypothetical protein
MRTIICGAAIATGILIVAVSIGHQSHIATASQSTANGVDVHSLETSIRLKALPQQDIAPEVYR